MSRAHWKGAGSILLSAILLFAAPRNIFCQSIPRILTNGIANAAGAALAPAPAAPGGIISIYGFDFNSSTGAHAGGVSAAPPLPTSIDGTEVLINSRLAPLYYVDSTQIDAQVPWEVPGAAYLTIQVIANGLPSNLATVPLASSAPGLLVVTHAQDGSLVSPSQPAISGEHLKIYAVGLGSVTNAPATGGAALPKPFSTTTLTPTLTIGGVAANVISSGLTPGFSGLYQLDAQVPDAVPKGDDVTVVLTAGGSISNVVVTSVQSSAPSTARITVSPVSVALSLSAKQQFTAGNAGGANSTMSWSVNGIPGGNAAVGTISPVGLYTAPATVPAGGLVYITATNLADASVTGTAVIAVSAPAAIDSPLGRFRSSGPGLWVQFEERGNVVGYWAGEALQRFNQADPVVGGEVSQEVSLQLDKMKAMGINSITYALRTAKSVDAPGQAFVPPACPEPTVLGLNWPQPTVTELTNLKAFFDLAQSKGMRVRLGLVNTHMEEQPPTNSTTWLGAIAGAIGNHGALDVITLDGTPLIVPSTPSGPPDKCGTPAEASLWYGPRTITTQYIEWAMTYLESLGVPARKLSAEAIVGNYLTDSMSSNSCPNCAADGHFWNPVSTLKIMFDQTGIADNQRTYALSFYEHTKCANIINSTNCTNLDPHSWAEQTIQAMYGIIGAGNGARVVATEMGDNPPVDPAWKTEWAMESLASLMEKYRIEGGSFWRWTNFSNCSSGCSNEDADPTLADPVKRRGVNFLYNPVQKEILDWAGFHLTAIPNGSFEDLDANGTPTHWVATGRGSASAYYIPQENGQPQVPSRGSYCLRLTASDSASAISATSDRIAVTPGTSYTTAANLRFAWSGDPNPSASPSTRPQVFVTVHYLNASGQPASVPSIVFPYFQENSTQGFQTFIFQYTTPNDAQSVQIEVGAARNGLAVPITIDADNLR